MPLADPEGPVDDDVILAAAGYYRADWASRKGELNDMLELENTNVSVIWQDPADRRAILLANQRDLSTTIARQLHHAAGTTAGPQRITTFDPGLQRLVHLLDRETEGDTAWLSSTERDIALPARLAHFHEQDKANIAHGYGTGRPRLSQLRRSLTMKLTKPPRHTGDTTLHRPRAGAAPVR